LNSLRSDTRRAPKRREPLHDEKDKRDNEQDDDPLTPTVPMSGQGFSTYGSSSRAATQMPRTCVDCCKCILVRFPVHRMPRAGPA
jgi:hypothetical protein